MVLCSYLGDGRFHLESIMISNPGLHTVRYDPYSKKFTKEGYETEKMHGMRQEAIRVAVETIPRCRPSEDTAGNDVLGPGPVWALVLGTLGRQGSPAILGRLQSALKEAKVRFITVLISELFPQKVELLLKRSLVWVQIACPRLSIDWGTAFATPLLNPYEAFVALGSVTWQSVYPMDFYRRDGGVWTNYYGKQKARGKAGGSGAMSALLRARAKKTRPKRAARAAIHKANDPDTNSPPGHLPLTEDLE